MYWKIERGILISESKCKGNETFIESSSPLEAYQACNANHVIVKMKFRGEETDCGYLYNAERDMRERIVYYSEVHCASAKQDRGTLPEKLLSRLAIKYSITNSLITYKMSIPIILYDRTNFQHFRVNIGYTHKRCIEKITISNAKCRPVLFKAYLDHSD